MEYRDICAKIKLLPKKDYYKLIEYMTNQHILDFKYICYKSTPNLVISPTKFKYILKQYEFFKIFYLDNEYHIFHIETNQLASCLMINDVRFVCFPIQYVNCHIQKSHVGTIVFDLVDNITLILEPNGVHPIEFVNKFMNMLLTDLKRFDFNFKFIPINIWLPSKTSLNYRIDEGIGIGICATSNLFLINKLLEYNGITELSNWLSNLTRYEIMNELKNFIDKKLIFQ